MGRQAFEQRGYASAPLGGVGRKLSEQAVLLGVNELPFFSVICRNPATVTRLRQAPELEWVMPSDSSAEALEKPVSAALNGPPAGTVNRELGDVVGEGFGCQVYQTNANLRYGADYDNKPLSGGNGLASWNYRYHFINDTWNRGYNGRGVRLFVIDTGVSQEQTNFGPGGAVARTISRFATLGTDANDLCGHGICMAGAAGASLRAGTSVGVAYGSDLTLIKAMNDVVITSDAESRAVAAAIKAIADRADSKNAVVSMSIGGPITNNIVDAAFNYLNNSSKRDKTIFFAAAGTSAPIAARILQAAGTNPLYPANRPDVYAVTGFVTYPQFSAADWDVAAANQPRVFSNQCEACFRYDDTDFGIVMNKDRDTYSFNGSLSATTEPLTQARSGNTPATVGGSSVATAQMAGIAALVWQRYPNMTRQQLYARLRSTGREVFGISFSLTRPVLPNAYQATN